MCSCRAIARHATYSRPLATIKKEEPMNTKKFIISTGVIFVMYAVMDILFYTYVFPEKYISKAVRQE